MIRLLRRWRPDHPNVPTSSVRTSHPYKNILTWVKRDVNSDLHHGVYRKATTRARKHPIISVIPSGIPTRAHSLLLIASLLAQMMLGMLPGTSIPWDNMHVGV